MITRIVKMHFSEDLTGEFLRIFDETHHLIRQSKGCLSLRLVRDIRDPGIFFTISQWTSEEELENYRRSELFRLTWERTKVLFSQRAKAWTTIEYSEPS